MLDGMKAYNAEEQARQQFISLHVARSQTRCHTAPGHAVAHQELQDIACSCKRHSGLCRSNVNMIATLLRQRACWPFSLLQSLPHCLQALLCCILVVLVGCRLLSCTIFLRACARMLVLLR